VAAPSGATTKWLEPESIESSGVCALAYDKAFPYSDEASAAGVHRSGGAGLLSTGNDYCKFLLAVLASLDGDMDRPRVLSRKMAEMMASNSLNGAPADWLGPGAGFGLGFNICMDPGAAGRVGSPGTLMWAGIFGTEYFIE